MRYTSDQKEEVKQLREKGYTLDQIQNQTRLPRTTIYDWIRNIPLSAVDKKRMKTHALYKLQKGRIAKEQRETEENMSIADRAKHAVGQLDKRNLLMVGTALYWAEGFKSKRENRLGFCNSDPYMIKIYLFWLQQCFTISMDQIVARVTLNVSYKEKTSEIEKHWSLITGIPSHQFTKPFFQRTIWRKAYQNDIYYGVLRIHVKKSSKQLHYVRGLISGLKSNIE